MGPIKLAQMTGAPIGAFHLEPEHAWTMHSWDRFLVPKPFTRIGVSWAQWTHVPADLPEEQFEPKREELNAAIERARLRALAHFGKRRCLKTQLQTVRVRSALRVADFDFDLPPELIAQQPPAERGTEPHAGDESRHRRSARCAALPIFPRCSIPATCWS